mmetsp:Transcript_24210/g.72637  ORF Transcript_24210/g.72637 Transcript_24210/m.72637 type:complete len:313 (-) Transcript_24210:150-1088(-)
MKPVRASSTARSTTTMMRTHTQRQHCFLRISAWYWMAYLMSTLPSSMYSPADLTWYSIWSSSSPCCSVRSAKSMNIWCSSATDCSRRSTSWYLSCASAKTAPTGSARSFRMAAPSTSPKEEPLRMTPLISAGDTSGLTMRSWRVTVFSISAFCRCCSRWYSRQTSPNLRVNVFARFSRMRCSEALTAPRCASVSAAIFVNKFFVRRTVTLVRSTRGPSSRLRRSSVSCETAYARSSVMALTRLAAFLMAVMPSLTSSTWPKKAAMNFDGPSSVPASTSSSDSVSKPKFSRGRTTSFRRDVMRFFGAARRGAS